MAFSNYVFLGEKNFNKALAEHFECVVNKQLWHFSGMVTFFTQLNSCEHSKAIRITRNKYYDEFAEFLNFCTHKHIPSYRTLSCMGVPNVAHKMTDHLFTLNVWNILACHGSHPRFPSSKIFETIRAVRIAVFFLPQCETVFLQVKRENLKRKTLP